SALIRHHRHHEWHGRCRCSHWTGMQEVIAVVKRFIACDKDWRAIEAGAHAYAARNGYYGSLSHYKVETSEDKGLRPCSVVAQPHDVTGRSLLCVVAEEYLVASMTLPLAVGTAGGALQSHPIYAFTHQLLRKPNAQRLAQVLYPGVCTGCCRVL